MRQGGGWVIDLDIRKFFDTLSHSLLRTILGQRMRDGVITRLIGKWLKAGVMENGAVSHAGQGTPQGGVLSPLLSNIYLHEVLDQWFTEVVQRHLRGRAFLVRFADDAVMVFTDRHDAERMLSALPKRFAKYGLTVHEEKTVMLRFVPPEGERAGAQRESFQPGVHSLLGTLAQGEMDRAAAHRERSAYPRATRCISLVQAPPACAAPGTASGPAEQAVRPLRVLRHHG